MFFLDVVSITTKPDLCAKRPYHTSIQVSYTISELLTHAYRATRSRTYFAQLSTDQQWLRLCVFEAGGEDTGPSLCTAVCSQTALLEPSPTEMLHPCRSMVRMPGPASFPVTYCSGRGRPLSHEVRTALTSHCTVSMCCVAYTYRPQ